MLVLSAAEDRSLAGDQNKNARAAETARMVGEAVRPILVLHDPRDVAHDMLMVLDASGGMARRFAGREGLVALSRPDGYLCYRGTPDHDGALASYLARVFALRMPGIGQGT